MKTHRRKSNKIPRTRLPKIERISINEPSMRFFYKIKNSLNLLEQTPNHEEYQKNHHFSIQRKKSLVTDRIQMLAMNTNRIPQSLQTSIEKEKPFLKSQRASRVKLETKRLLPKIQSQEQIGPQFINSKPLGDQSILAYQMLDNSESPPKHAKVNMETASELDSFEDDDLKSPLLIEQGLGLIARVSQQIIKGRQQYLFDRIMGEHPYQEKYVEYHRKLIEKDRPYEVKRYKMNHKSDWRG